MKELNEVEKKVLRLIEERGVAASKYNLVADEIIRYCEKRTPSRGKSKFFTIPSNITKKIDFIENLVINVKITDNNDGNNYSGGGKCITKYSNVTTNGKIKDATIEIYAYSYLGVLYKKTVLNSLYHELNHCYDYYKDCMQNNGVAVRYVNTAKKANIEITDVFKNKTDNNNANIIFYRLFSETELNAIIASVYGDLKGMGSKRENFKSDILKTQAYILYAGIKTVYKQLFSKIDEHNLNRLKNCLNYYGIEINPYGGDNIESFKKELIRKTGFLLKRLIRGIGRASSLYYDNVEIEPLPEVIIHVDDTGKIIN